ncbi:MAG: tryptophan 2,3-dioxygenase family protein [Candidatus Cyclobacteriaceae bacterium M2_1C_046]
MESNSIDPKIIEQVKKLEAKYEAMGQDLSSYLDGLLYADYLTYWDYIHLDTLLSLQNPKTQQKDEMIFIIYHQFTELFFKLIIHEQEQICNNKAITAEEFTKRIRRIVRYFQNLENSFDVMVDGLDRDEFLKFRMALLPASGFQSAQYRLIEIYSTELKNLVGHEERLNIDPSGTLEEMFQHFYWRKGATELASGKTTLTLKQFEEKYMDLFLDAIKAYEEKNIWHIYKQKFAGLNDEEMITAMRQFDVLANLYWPLAHYKAAVRHLHKSPDDLKATGGTNWQKYLPPRFQKIIFFPALWSENEHEEWGKAWVKKEIFGDPDEIKKGKN